MSGRDRKKVFVGVSGGVDSSVAAYLLQQEGYEVHGIFVKTWAPEWLPCTWVAEKRDAMRVCAKLGIPFHYLDATEEYKQGVADYMIAEYRAGRTPNPDVLCNRVVKFGAMWSYAKNHGADLLATGHYAQVVDGALLKGVDAAKDQSYFLWMLTNDDLSHTLFPIGGIQKSEVRAVAEKAGLFTASKKDSQGICFLGEVDMKDFLRHYINEQPGDILNEAGEKVGEHDGAVFHTLGERHGFRITEKSTDRAPYYVVGKHIETNTLIVSHTKKGETTEGKVVVRLRDTNWRTSISRDMACDAQIRYHGALLPARIIDESHVELSNTEGLIPLGQSLVLYNKEICIGGGVIDEIN